MANFEMDWKALASGVAGACALTLLHEGVRRAVPDAPRMDVLGERRHSPRRTQKMRNEDAGTVAEQALCPAGTSGRP